jgi:hypothetical protein
MRRPLARSEPMTHYISRVGVALCLFAGAACRAPAHETNRATPDVGGDLLPRVWTREIGIARTIHVNTVWLMIGIYRDLFVSRQALIIGRVPLQLELIRDRAEKRLSHGDGGRSDGRCLLFCSDNVVSHRQ